MPVVWGQASASPTSTGSSVGRTIGNVLSSTAELLNNTYSNYVNAQIAGGAMANSASAAAQKQQFEYNKELMNLQNAKQEEYLQRMMDFNTSSAVNANAFTEKMWNKAADYNTNMFNAEQNFTKEMYGDAKAYNAEQARINREWQERMSNTAYQRAIQDMKAAGINPILAAQNGGANVGSGATASIGTANGPNSSMGSASGAQAASTNASAAGGSVGNYSGQGYHLSDTMAIGGAILGTIGQVISGLQANNTLGKAGISIQSKLGNTAATIANEIAEDYKTESIAGEEYMRSGGVFPGLYSPINRLWGKKILGWLNPGKNNWYNIFN